MSDKQNFSQESAAEQRVSSNGHIPEESHTPSEFDRQQFTSQRGDTGVLLSQLSDFVSMTSSSNPITSSALSISSPSTSSYSQPQSKISSSDIEDSESQSERQKCLVVLVILNIALVSGLGVFAHMRSSFSQVAPLDSPTQPKIENSK
jgi:hypothetical protein